MILRPAKRGRGVVVALLLAVTLGSPLCARAQDGPKPQTRVEQLTVDDLVAGLSSKDDGERKVAEHELMRRKQASLGPLVAALKKKPTPELRSAAMRVFRKVGDPAPSDALVAIYRDASLAVEQRVDAALILGEIKAAKAIPALLAGLADLTSLRLCEASRIGLEIMGTEAEEPVVRAYVEERGKGKDAREAVLCRLLLIMGRIGGDRARAELTNAIKTPDRDPKGQNGVTLRHHAAIGLGNKDDKLSIEPLIAALEVEKEFNVAKYITRSLEKLTNETLPPQGGRWRNWWEANKHKFLPQKDLFNPLPPKGIPKGEK